MPGESSYQSTGSGEIWFAGRVGWCVIARRLVPPFSEVGEATMARGGGRYDLALASGGIVHCFTS